MTDAPDETLPPTAPDRDHPGPSPWLRLISLGLAVLVAGQLYGLGVQDGGAVDLEAWALGDVTKEYFAEVDGHPIHCRDLRDLEACLAGHEARGLSRAALWLGNSQIHSINQLEDDDASAPALLADDLRSRGVDLVTVSQPNANLQEHLALFSYLRPRLPLSHVVLPLVFDDLRESGVRATITGVFHDPEALAALERHEVGRAILAQNESEPEDSDIAALDQTVQEHTETWLNDTLDEHWSAWKHRPDARGWIFRRLRRVRNTAFGITAQTKRKLLPARRELNLSAATALLDEAREHGIQTVVYVVPLRRDVEIPYDEAEYERFKQDARVLAETAGARFVDLEGLVPARYWGEKAATNLGGKKELDFMHFQGPGHALLADALGDVLASLMQDSRT